METVNELTQEEGQNSMESENQSSDLEENVVANKKLMNNKLDCALNRLTTSVRKENLVNKDNLKVKNSQLAKESQLKKQIRKCELANDKFLIKKDDDCKQTNLDLLHKIFPTIQTIELASCLTNSNGELVKAIQQLVFKQQSNNGKNVDCNQVTNNNKKNSFIDDKTNNNQKNVTQFISTSTGKQLNDSLLLNESNILNNLKTNLQTNPQNNLTSLSVNHQKSLHSSLFNSPCHSPHGQSLFKAEEAFRSSNNLFYSTNVQAKTSDTLCSAPTSTNNHHQPQNANNLNAIQVNHLLAQQQQQQQNSSTSNNQQSSASYLSMLASMSNQMENSCFNNQNLFDPILQPSLNDAMIAMATQQQLKRNNLYNGNSGQTTQQANNKNLTNLSNLTAFQRTILNENNTFPYPLYPFLFGSTNELANSIQSDSLKSSLVAAIAQQQQKNHIQQADLNGAQQQQFTSNENVLMSTFNHLLTGQEELNSTVKEKDTSLTSGSSQSQCSSPETNQSRSPIKYSA